MDLRRERCLLSQHFLYVCDELVFPFVIFPILCEVPNLFLAVDVSIRREAK